MGKMIRVCGIYQIRCLINNRIYIGQSSSIKMRWHDHKHHLRFNKHGNEYLQSDWNLHGEINFVFEIVEKCPQEQLIEREQYYLDLYPGSYNVRKKSDPKLASCRAVKQICKRTFKVVKTWNSIVEAQTHFGRPGGNISLCCRNGYSQFGFYWCYANEDFDPTKAKWWGKRYGLSVVQRDLDGNILQIWNCASEAERSLDPNKNNYCMVSKKAKLGQVYMGYKWEIYDPIIHGERY